MLKKILIALVIIALLVSGGVYYSYKKFEAKFESIMFAEVEKKRAEIEQTLQDKIALEEKSSEDEISTVVPEEETIIEVEEDTNIEEDTTVEEESVTPTDVIEEDETITESEEKSEEVVTETDTIDTVVEEVEPEPVAEVEPEPVKEIYTVEDFDRDKKIALDLAMSRLSASQLSKLMDLSDGGFTSEEKVEAKEMFYSNFSQEEQDWILSIYDQYYDLVNEG